MQDDIWEIRPLGARKYNVRGIRIHSKKDNPRLLRQVFNETAWFYKK